MVRTLVKVAGAADTIVDQTVGTVGSIANEQGAMDDSFLTGIGLTASNVAVFAMDVNANKTAGTASATLSPQNTPVFNEKGFFGRESVCSLNNTYLGSDDHHLSSTDTFFDPGDIDFAVFGWFKSEGWHKDELNTLFAQWRGGGNSSFLFRSLHNAGGNSINLTTSIDGTAEVQHAVTGGSLALTKGAWHHLGFKYDATAETVTIYIDGQPALKDSAVGGSLHTAGVTREFEVGVVVDQFDEFSGQIQDIVFINGDLVTDAQVNAIYSRRFTNSQQIAGGHVLDADSFPFSDLTDKVSFYNMSTANDGSVNAANLTSTGGITIGGAAGIHGVASTATEFDGVDDGLSVDGAENTVQFSKMSIGGWFKPDTWFPGTDYSLISRYGSAGNRSFIFRITNSDTIQAITYEDGSNAVLNSSYVISGLREGWHHIMWVLDGVNSILYIDGIARNTVAYSGIPHNPGSNTDLSIGWRGDGADYFTGIIDEVEVSPVAFSADEVRKLASARIDLASPHDTTDPDDQEWTGVVTSEDSLTKSGLTTGDDVSRAVVQEWTSFSPTITIGGTTATDAGHFYYRQGDTIFVRGGFTSVGTGSGGSSVTASLPSGLTLDGSALPNATVASGQNRLGDAYNYDVENANAWSSVGGVIPASTTEIRFLNMGQNAVYLDTGMTAGAGFFYSYTARIAEWAGETEAKAVIVDKKTDKIYVDTAGNPGDTVKIKLRKHT